jgi:hypothetical protein
MVRVWVMALAYTESGLARYSLKPAAGTKFLANWPGAV